MSKEFEEKRDRRREREANKIRSLPTIAMCEWYQGNDEKGKFIHRSKVIKLRRRSVTMRGIGSDTCLVTVGVEKGHPGNIEDFPCIIKIEKMPCDTTEWTRADEKMKEYIETIKARGETA
jgi:hypothetical protein